MHDRKVSRRQLLGAAPASAALVSSSGRLLYGRASQAAMLGGQPVRTAPWPRWPVFRESDERAVLPVLRSGVWSRAKVVDQAEERFARLMGAPYCLATCNGTNAIITAVRALGIGAGDDVIPTPYTFVASVLPILLAEAPGGEWRNRKVGTLGDLGCFSFQNGKSLTCGEGGAVLGHDRKLMDRCYSFHNMGRPYGSVTAPSGEGHVILGTKCRMAEYQASILMTQIENFDAECRRRSENAAYLTEKLKQIPGIVPRKDYPQVTRTAFYYYGFRYKKEQFNGLSREKFIAALRKEGVPSSKGLGVIEGKPINKEGCVEDALRSKAYQAIYPRQKLANYAADNQCPECDRLVEETVGFHQSMLLGARQDMDDIYRAVAKIYENRQALAAQA